MTKARWLTAKQEHAWKNYRRMRTLLDLQLARDLAGDSSLSEADYDVLSTLSEAENHRWRATDLARRLLWSTSRLAHHVGRMEARGLLRREASKEDGRGAVIVLTAKGWRTLSDAAPLHVASVREHFIDLLSDADVAALDQIARKVVEHLSGFSTSG